VSIGRERKSGCRPEPNTETTLEDTARIFLLGRTEAFGINDEKLLPNPRKTRAVFAYLCLCRGEILAKARVADLIWDRSGSVQSLDALRHALADLSQVRAPWRLERERHTVRLDARACWIDAFEVPDRPDRLLDDLQGVSVSFDHWIMEERARFETRWRAALERNLESLIAENAGPARRASAARDLLSVLPTHDAAVRALMKAFIDMDEPAEAIRSRCGAAPEVAIVLGSGLGDFATTLGDGVRFPYTELPHWPRSTVVGHAGLLVVGNVAGRRVAALAGRVHAYEGHSHATLAFAVRVMRPRKPSRYCN